MAAMEDSVDEMAFEVQDGRNERMIKEFNHLLQIFPEEVWIMILEKSGPNELENTSNASPYFRNLLQDKRVLFLFPKVWDVLALQSHQMVTVMFENPFSQAHSSYMVSSLSGLLRLRLVCQTWSSAIDHLFQIQAANQELNDFANRVGQWINYCFTQARQHPQNFLDHFDSTHGNSVVGGGTNRNPFLNRRICIIYRWTGNFIQFCAQVDELLRNYGVHLWYCTIKLLQVPHLGVAYDVLSTVLHLMPNLKVLSLEYRPPYFIDHVSVAYQLEHLRSVIQSAALPTLENLQFLMAGKMPSLIFNELVRTNGHVPRMEVGKCGLHLRNSAIYSIPVPNLNQLALSLHDEADVRNLESSRTNWPLQKLQLNLTNFPTLSLRNIFTLLEHKWQVTLTELTLNLLVNGIQILEASRILEPCKSAMLNLPNLQRLELLMPEFFALDFILPMRNNLEILDVTVTFSGPLNGNGNHGQIMCAEMNSPIRFFRSAERPRESNIWRLFPNLERITFNKSIGRGSKIKLWSHCRREWMEERQP